MLPTSIGTIIGRFLKCDSRPSLRATSLIDARGRMIVPLPPGIATVSVSGEIAGKGADEQVGVAVSGDHANPDPFAEDEGVARLRLREDRNGDESEAQRARDSHTISLVEILGGVPLALLQGDGYRLL